MTDYIADEARALLAFWFDELTPQQWFERDATIDAKLAAAFAELPARALAGELDGWATTAEGALALVLVLDQLPRNLYRGTAQAFEGDARARDVARRAIAQHLDRDLDTLRRLFLYLPFEHGEALADQEWAVALIEALGDPIYADYARRHRDVIVRFGRFPHRNEALGRSSTPDELAYLAEPGAGF